MTTAISTATRRRPWLDRRSSSRPAAVRRSARSAVAAPRRRPRWRRPCRRPCTPVHRRTVRRRRGRHAADHRPRQRDRRRRLRRHRRSHRRADGGRVRDAGRRRVCRAVHDPGPRTWMPERSASRGRTIRSTTRWRCTSIATARASGSCSSSRSRPGATDAMAFDRVLDLTFDAPVSAADVEAFLQDGLDTAG